MELVSELVKTMNIFIMKPLSFIRGASLLGVRTTLLVMFTWFQLVKVVIYFHLDLCWKIMIWTAALVSLPARILTSLQRQRLLESHLNGLQLQLECLLWENRELERQLRVAIKDQKIMEAALMEIQEEHEKSTTKINLLENELQELKHENLQLYEAQGKNVYDYKEERTSMTAAVNDDDKSLVSSWASPSCVLLPNFVTGKEKWEDPSKEKHQKSRESISSPYSPRFLSSKLLATDATDQCKETAFLQTIFSIMLSVAVGIVIWKAGEPCMPLIAALFVVVGLSLKTVVQFFSTLKSKAVSDAITLLSLNWFVLGTLTYPALPSLIRILTYAWFRCVYYGIRLSSHVEGLVGLSSL